MVFPGFFLEYLITGSCALFWLYGFSVWWPFPNSSQLSAGQVTILIPALYVIGMLIDNCSRYPLVGLRKLLRRVGWANGLESDGDATQAEVWLSSAELSKQIEIRSSRDRIARGAVGNLVAATTVYSFAVAKVAPGELGRVLLAGVFLIVVAVAVWIRVDKLTSKFRRHACEALAKRNGEKVC